MFERTPTTIEVVIIGAVVALASVCAMIVALAITGESNIIPTILVIIGNLVLQVITLVRVEQSKKTTDDTKITTDEIKHQVINGAESYGNQKRRDIG